ALYTLNWLVDRLWEVGTAYRLTMGLHSVAVAAATFAYARVLGLTRAGSALAAVSFALCGFQAIHTVHEPFYHVMPYLPLCLLLADRYAATGRPAWLAGLAGLGHPDHARTLPDPDVDGRAGAVDRRMAGVDRRRDPRFAASAGAGVRAGRGAWLGRGDRLGATAADLGIDRGRGVRPAARVPGELRAATGPLGSARAAGGLPVDSGRRGGWLLGCARH